MEGELKPIEMNDSAVPERQWNVFAVSKGKPGSDIRAFLGQERTPKSQCESMPTFGNIEHNSEPLRRSVIPLDACFNNSEGNDLEKSKPKSKLSTPGLPVPCKSGAFFQTPTREVDLPVKLPLEF